nr:unnamed protein product [Digitaria exilis]
MRNRIKGPTIQRKELEKGRVRALTLLPRQAWHRLPRRHGTAARTSPTALHLLPLHRAANLSSLHPSTQRRPLPNQLTPRSPEPGAHDAHTWRPGAAPPEPTVAGDEELGGIEGTLGECRAETAEVRAKRERGLVLEHSLGGWVHGGVSGAAGGVPPPLIFLGGPIWQRTSWLRGPGWSVDGLVNGRAPPATVQPFDRIY